MPSTSFFCVDFCPPLWYHENRIEYPAQVPQLLRIRGKPVKIRRNFHYCEGDCPHSQITHRAGVFGNTFRGKLDGATNMTGTPKVGSGVLCCLSACLRTGKTGFFLWKGVAEWPITKDRSNALPCCARRRKPWDGCPKRVTFRRRSWVRSKIS